MNNKYQQEGFSLIELVITIVVLGIALAALSSSVFNAVGKNADPLWQSKATQLSQAYLDEILAMKYQEDSPLGGGSVGSCSSTLGPDTGESTRSLYNDVDDYHNLSESADFLDTTTTSSYSGYQVSIQVSCDNQSIAGLNSKLIVLTVTSPTGDQIDFSVFKADI